MGLLRRVVRKVKKGLAEIHEEAKHPGRPPTYKAAESPFWVEPEEKLPPRPAGPPVEQPAASPESATPWYLDGAEEAEGWEKMDATKD